MSGELEATVRHRVRACVRASLGTMSRSGGAPYTSLVVPGTDMAGAPLLLLSDLAEHTQNLKADSRASLLIDGSLEAGADSGPDTDPLTGTRATLQGNVKPVPAEACDALIARYTRRYPDGAMFARFGDFNLYRMEVTRAHIVAGFGRIHWVEGAFRIDAPDALVRAEADIVDHMNEDHLDAVGLYANRLLGLDGVGWRMVGIDPEGCDLRRAGRDGGAKLARLTFDTRISDAQSARTALVECVRKARAI